MSLNEVSLRIPTEHMANVFGQFDANIKKIERTLGVTKIFSCSRISFAGRSLCVLIGITFSTSHQIVL